MPDNVRRGLRTVIQVFVALILTGVFDQFVIDLLDSFEVASDSSIRVTVGFILVFVMTWAMNAAEDATGFSVLAPRDRVIGDAQMQTGLGEKTPDAGITSRG